ncbi:hypothetical protein BZG36_00517 [Bifiguratus adelaidae]|uniref:glucan 1,3-beta-glucosidase n=1 Tax=Bifiguratus adelaidae TaxID=1938954 RepID=A0A261Y701_9FUNG|nr:hypothetical protein BZG36_00517 [Bifiguratus adelaidae]
MRKAFKSLFSSSHNDYPGNSGLNQIPFQTQPAAPTVKGRGFVWGRDKVRGVNLGGWLVLEKWITPTLFQQYAPKAKDEWTFCQQLGPRALQALQGHWNTWVTEQDIARLSSMGLNMLRIPIGYWAFQLKGVPGSQNGFDNSGRQGPIEWTKGGYNGENIQRSLAVVQQVVDIFIRDSEFSTTVNCLQLVNECANWGLDMNVVKQYYETSYKIIRSASSEIKIVLHDGFQWYTFWNGFMRPPDYQNVLMDTHKYQCFDNSMKGWSRKRHMEHTDWLHEQLEGSDRNLWTIVGEWSLALIESRGGHPNTWDAEYRSYMKEYAERQMAVYERASGWIYWNFKTEDAPEWNYMLLVETNIIPNPPNARFM